MNTFQDQFCQGATWPGFEICHCTGSMLPVCVWRQRTGYPSTSTRGGLCFGCFCFSVCTSQVCVSLQVAALTASELEQGLTTVTTQIPQALKFSFTTPHWFTSSVKHGTGKLHFVFAQVEVYPTSVCQWQPQAASLTRSEKSPGVKLCTGHWQKKV